MSESSWMHCRQWVGELAGNRDGVTSIEYGLIAAAVAIALAAVVLLFSGEVADMFTTVESAVSKVPDSN